MRKSKRVLAIILILAFMLMIVPVSASETSDAMSVKIDELLNVIEKNYYKDVKTEDLIDGAMKGMMDTLDKHSAYFTAEEYKNFVSTIDGEIIGIGVSVELKNNALTVVAPIEGTPAYKAGIKAGDVIKFVDGADITSFEMEKSLSLIRGVAGTKVKIGIIRNNSAEPINYNIIREVVKINPVKYEIKPGNIGYIRITEFNSHVVENMDVALKHMEDKNVKGLIIDLRNNPGGLLGAVIDICQELIPAGPIVHIQQKGEITETYSSVLEKAPYKIVVMVDGGSASASEIMAGAIKDSGTGILLGENTYGKGTVQNLDQLESGAGFKLTIANYLTPSKFSLDGIGLKPDVVVKDTRETDFTSAAPLKEASIIKYKTVSLDVLALQQRLKKLGYAISDGDGYFNTSTKAAVLKFQKDYKLPQDAIMNPADNKVLETKFEEKIAKSDPQLDRALIEIKKMLKSN